MGTFNEDLKRDLQDPEFVAHFANAQAESQEELLRAGVIKQANITSLSNKTRRTKYEALLSRKEVSDERRGDE